MAFPATAFTNSADAADALQSSYLALGGTLDSKLNIEGVQLAILANVFNGTQANQYFQTRVPASESITAAGALSVTTQVSSLVGPAASTYAVTLAAPASSGILKMITMASTTGSNTVTLALTNVVGQSSGTSCAFDAAGDTLLLFSNATKWVVFKEYNVTLS